MATMIEFAQSWMGRLTDVANRPARTLAATMDRLDEVWVVDTFMD